VKYAGCASFLVDNVQLPWHQPIWPKRVQPGMSVGKDWIKCHQTRFCLGARQ